MTPVRYVALGASASETSTSSLAVFVQVKATGFQVRVRERAPLRLSIVVQTPAGITQRWGADDPKPGNAPSGLTFSTAMPGGDEQLGCTLARNPSREYPDLQELATLTILGAGGRQVAGQFRLEQLPDVSGDQMQVSPGAPGWQAHLSDDNSAREVFVDQNITSWQGPSVERQIQWLQNPGGLVTANGPSVGPNFSNSTPSLITELDGTWTEAQVVEAWYDAHGIPLGKLFAEWSTNASAQNPWTLGSAPSFGAGMFLPGDDAAISYDQFNPVGGAPGAAWLNATTLRYWALLQFFNDQQPGGKDGVNFQTFWDSIGVYGAHGLPLYTTADNNGVLGLLASDMLAYVINRWCPKLEYSTGSAGSIQPSAFVIPQAVFLDPVKASDMLADITKYELLDWAVEPGPGMVPTFYLNGRGARGRKWLARSGSAKLQQAGPQIGRLWNGVIVQWNDVLGISRTVGPPGAGCNYASSALQDTDPLNPLNEAGIRKYALVTMGSGTLASATQIGSLFLIEQRKLGTSGQAALVGYVLDGSSGVWEPAWKVRAGDQISFTDAADTRYRRIVHTNYDEPTVTNSIQLDQPPDSLQALLSRLSIVLAPYGLS
ncbi:MAG: hypothetical protein LC685_04370 [Actinobacteria bacterium]|nr:hypothetical protein [Actinomycetota bacterium]